MHVLDTISDLVFLQYLGSLFGILGAIFVAQPDRRRRQAGFSIWIASNVCLCTWALSTGAWGLVAMQTFFFATSLMGVYNNRSVPAAA